MRISVFDIGGTWIKHATFDGHTLENIIHIPTEASLGAAQMIDKLISALSDDLKGGMIDAIGISTRGQVDHTTGTILYDPPEIFPGYTGVCLPQKLREAFASDSSHLSALQTIPIVVENDANCAALAESIFGTSKHCSDSLMLTFGTCIGGGIILNQQIYHGNCFSAGEFGMMYLPDENGKPAHWEQLASSRTLKSNPQLWQQRIAMGLASLIHIFNPPCVVLGGGLMENHQLSEAICQETRKLLAPGFDKVTIGTAALGNHAGMLGAGYLAICTKR